MLDSRWNIIPRHVEGGRTDEFGVCWPKLGWKRPRENAFRYFRGMQKRVGLARALALEPEILLLDEPTAGLDPISSGEINDLVLKLQREHKMASIVVTHDLHSARTIADRLAMLNKGLVVIEGSLKICKKATSGL